MYRKTGQPTPGTGILVTPVADCRIHVTAGMALCPDAAIVLSYNVLQTLEAS
jgi:hypothetical protein